MVSESEFLSSFETIKEFHNEIFHIADFAVRCEEQEKPLDALKNYKKCIEIIDETLSLPVGIPDNVDKVKTEWDEAFKMIHKLKRARAEIVQRIGILSQKINVTSSSAVEDNKNIKIDNITTYPSDNELGRPRTYTELAEALKDLECSDANSNSLELIFYCENVKLYSINPNGIVTTTSDDSTMRILCLERDENKKLNRTYFIQIIKTTNAVPLKKNSVNLNVETNTADSPSPSSSFCVIPHPSDPKDNFNSQDESSWIYPLVPSVSPCFRTEYGAFIFPDLESTRGAESFGVIVPSEDKCDEIVLEILEAILHGVVIDGKRDFRGPNRDISTSVSENLIRGAHFISRNIVKGAEKTGEFMTYSTPYIISKIKKAPDDSETPLSTNVVKSVQVAKSVTDVAANITGCIASKVGNATMALGKFLAPHIQKHGSTLLSKGFGITEEDANEKMSGVLTIAAGAVEGFGTVYAGLEESAKILGNNLGSNSVKIIEHKYGTSTGSVAINTFDTIGNVINLSQNVNYMTPKGLAKHTAKNAGKAIVGDYRPSTSATNSYIPASSLYPNLNGMEIQIKK